MPHESAERTHAILLESMRLNGDVIRGRAVSIDRNDQRRIGESEETRDALRDRNLELLTEKVEALQSKYEALAAQRDRAMVMGLIALGSAVLAMGGFVLKIAFGKVGL